MAKTKEEKAAAARAYYRKNPEKCRASCRNYYARNREQLRAKMRARQRRRYAEDLKFRERTKQMSRDWHEKNPGANAARSAAWRKINPGYQVAYTKQRMLSDPEFAIATRVRNRINTALRRSRRGVKSAKTIELLGCTTEFYMAYLELRFLPGMTWENRQLWHIDHIIPLARFDLMNPKQQRAAFHFTNTQPLWKPDNLRKGAKLAA